ncbi:MAG: GNAT family N-acetyltransferase [Gammaproteobacteria bacterium]|nr:GNAT family N-acetyltransferase [Gammaproteobacteria bacterium]MCP5198974.1 GNAT family N-acetyltransferase [Gammaproteobacteria bacterium]
MLPVADLEASQVELLGAWSSGELVGVIGLECHGRDALLRSLAVCAERRGQGIGTRLVGALEARARGAGVERLWLLTETAASFFAARGYRRVDRAAAPAALAASREFAALCPATATCMARTLTPLRA